jgi:hypothetical protein|tara:strand:+ start:37 stop:510 length:474 start_codon:yes stop_codon:yes gene_type:complete
MTREELRNALLKKSNMFATNYVVVANTYMNISYDLLTHKLNLLNAKVNKKLFKYFRKYPDKRIQFAYNHQRVNNNTHSHMILKVPDEYYQPHTELLKIRDLMWFSWLQLDYRKYPKNRLWFEKVDDEPTSRFFNVRYAVRETKKDTAQNTEFRFGIL